MIVNWVLDRIIEEIAAFDLLVSEFGLQEALAPAERKGPLDRDREEEFAEIEVASPWRARRQVRAACRG